MLARIICAVVGHANSRARGDLPWQTCRRCKLITWTRHRNPEGWN